MSASRPLTHLPRGTPLIAKPSAPLPRPQCLSRALPPRRHASTHTHVPRIAQQSFWTSLTPKFLRSAPITSRWQRWRPAAWSPATSFVILALFVGSNAINTLKLRRETADFRRKADARIALLREVVERIGRGEEVDVEKILGTGREREEGEWDEVLKEMVEEDRTWQSRKRRKAAAAETQEPADTSETKAVAASVPEEKSKPATGDVEQPEKRGPVGFY